MTKSGGGWGLRQGLHYKRLCARPGCGAPATSTLRFQPTLRQAWLVDLDGTTARTQGDLCHRHADALVLPRGWELHDERSGGGPRLVDGKAAAAATPPRRVRVRRRPKEKGPEPEPNPLPGFEPVVVGSNVYAAPPETDPQTVDAQTVKAQEIQMKPVEAQVVDEPVEAEAAEEAGAIETPDEQLGDEEVVEAEVAATKEKPGLVPATDVDDDALHAILDARTPLLQRAFRNAKPDNTQ